MPTRVQAAGRDDEPDAVQQAALAGRQFRAVSVAMKDGEEADQDSRKREWRADFEHHGCAQQDGRGGDAILDSRERYAHQAEHSAERHHHRESHRQNPNGRAAQLRAPEADGNHRQHVIETGDGVLKAGEKTFGLA